MTTSLTQDDEKNIRELLIGRRVISVNQNKMVLDNGTEILVRPNEGCGGCSSGWYELEVLERVDNIITRVDFETTHTGNYDSDTSYKIFVLAGDERINLLSVDGTDGNGFYGTGYELEVEIK